MDEVTSIEIPELMVLGDTVAGIGARFAEAVAGIDGWAQSAHGTVDGSVTCDVQIGASAGDWRSTLTLLAGSIQAFGRGLHRAAADYWTADLDAQQRLGRSGAAPR